jgi:hypothetical protein
VGGRKLRHQRLRHVRHADLALGRLGLVASPESQPRYGRELPRGGERRFGRRRLGGRELQLLLQPGRVRHADLALEWHGVAVYVGATKIGTISLYATTTHYQRLLLLPRFSLGTRTVTIKVLSSGKTVQIDGLLSTRT